MITPLPLSVFNAVNRGLDIEVLPVTSPTDQIYEIWAQAVTHAEPIEGGHRILFDFLLISVTQQGDLLACYACDCLADSSRCMRQIENDLSVNGLVPSWRTEAGSWVASTSQKEEETVQ